MMKNLKSTTAALAIFLTTAFTIAPVSVYAQTYGAPAQNRPATANQQGSPAQPAPQTQAPSSKDDNWASVIIGAAILVGLVLALGSSGSSSSSSSSASAKQDYDPDRYNRQAPSQPAYRHKPDTSAGCVWGDRAYGTCH
jgi:hypothetical protein